MALMDKLPLNIKLMDVNDFIKRNGCKEVTTSLIHESSSTAFHKDGLFSEEIFGEVASDARFMRHGWINLHCKVFCPIAFQNLQALKRFYVEIMSGRSFAKWDKEQADFVRADEFEEGAGTGYAFFLSHYNDIDFKKTASIARVDKINNLIRYKDRILIDKFLVIPAGIRDLKEEGSRIEKDSINSAYTSLLANAKAMPEGCDLDPIYDQVHYSIQRKVMEIHEYMLELLTGKKGFFEHRYAARAVALGTRNVITATSLESTSPESPQYHKVDETKVPLYQAAKAYILPVVHYIRTVFYGPIVTESSDNIPLIDSDSMQLSYVPVDDKIKDEMLTAEGVQKLVDRFRDPEYRFQPFAVNAGEHKTLHYFYLVYDLGKKIYVFRNLVEFRMALEENHIPYDPSKVRPLTYAEMLYVATYVSSKDKYGTVTRYPVTDNNSIYTSKCHLMSTSPSRTVTWVTDINSGEGLMLPEYPTIGAGFVDAMMLHPSKLKGLGADFDGDTVSFIALLGKEATEENDKYMLDKSNFVEPSGRPVTACDDLCSITMFALTRDPPKK